MFNYEIQPLYSIRMRVLDSNGLMKEKVYIIRIQDAQEHPTNIFLSKTEIDHDSAVNTEIGTFKANDEDKNETFTYQLIVG